MLNFLSESLKHTEHALGNHFPELLRILIALQPDDASFRQFILDIMLFISGEFDYEGKICYESPHLSTFKSSEEGIMYVVKQAYPRMIMLKSRDFCLVIDKNAAEVELSFVAHTSAAFRLFQQLQFLACRRFGATP